MTQRPTRLVHEMDAGGLRKSEETQSKLCQRCHRQGRISVASVFLQKRVRPMVADGPQRIRFCRGRFFIKSLDTAANCLGKKPRLLGRCNVSVG